MTKPLKGIEYLDTLPDAKQEVVFTQLLGALNCLRNIYHVLDEHDREHISGIFERTSARLIQRCGREMIMGEEVHVMPVLLEICEGSTFLKRLILRLAGN